MFVGPDHPIFGNRGGSSLDDPSGLFGGPQPLPRYFFLITCMCIHIDWRGLK